MDLNAPLGMTPPPPRRRSRLPVLAGGIGATAVAGLGLALAFGDPHGGRPFVSVNVPPMPPAAPARDVAPPAVEAGVALDTTPTATVAPPVGAAATVRSTGPGRAASLESGVLVHRGSGDGEAEPRSSGAGPGPLIIDVTRALDMPLGKPRNGSAGGTTPTDPAKRARPRVAIFVSGMGPDAAATRTATDVMPPAVTLAFLPYGKEGPSAVTAAKGKGHEVLLQLPMRNAGGAVPGPHALRPDASTEALNADLAWLLDRFDGYDGVTNLLGAPVTADTATMTIVLKALRARHLFFLDDGTSRASVANDVAHGLDTDAVKADVVLDATADPAVVRANLDQLVVIARRNGQAIGMASGLPEHLGLIGRFAAEVGAKGVDLVPVNALVRDARTAPAGTAASR